MMKYNGNELRKLVEMFATNHSYKIRCCSKEDANKHISTNIKKEIVTPDYSQVISKPLEVDTLFTAKDGHQL